MNKLQFKFVFVFVFLVISCNKSEDGVKEIYYDETEFFRVNGINQNDFQNFRGPYVYPQYESFRYCCGFKVNTDDYYIWFCDEKDVKIISQTIINIPKQIVEDQGFGDIVTCERGTGPWSLYFVDQVNDINLYCFTPNYDNLKNGFSYLLLFNGNKLYPLKLNMAINENWRAIEWYNKSILLGRDKKDFFYCVSEKGELIAQIDDYQGSRWYAIFQEDCISIPTSYTEFVSLTCSKLTNEEYGIMISIDSSEKKQHLYIMTSSPFDAKEVFKISTASLLEKKDDYFLIECQLVAYSGTKKTVKIKIIPSERSAMIVE